ncbi:hypothetical protein [Afipia felis]
MIGHQGETHRGAAYRDAAQQENRPPLPAGRNHAGEACVTFVAEGRHLTAASKTIGSILLVSCIVRAENAMPFPEGGAIFSSQWRDIVSRHEKGSGAVLMFAQRRSPEIKHRRSDAAHLRTGMRTA